MGFNASDAVSFSIKNDAKNFDPETNVRGSAALNFTDVFLFYPVFLNQGKSTLTPQTIQTIQTSAVGLARLCF